MPANIKVKGNPVPLAGTELKVGDTFPTVKLNKDLFTQISTSEFAGKRVIYSVVPSLDTGICDLQAKRFNEELGKLGDSVIAAIVSRDLPPAMARWCGAITPNENLRLLSDANAREFGSATGTEMPSVGILSRAVFVTDEAGKIVYIEYVDELTSHPDYDSALAAAKA
ncbi:MAG: thiol peroxidase [Sumerlaeia bacterium]